MRLPDPEKLMSPPEAVPAAVALPASRKAAVVDVLVVENACVTDRNPSVTQLIVLSDKAIVRSDVWSLNAPVRVAETLPVPEILVAIVVLTERL